MILLLAATGCGPKVPPGTLADSGDTARRDTAGDTGPVGPDDDCDGRDDDRDGTVDDGAAPGWWRDPARWRPVATFEDPEDQHFVAAIAAGDEVYVLVQEVAGDFSTGAVSLQRVDGGTVSELARLDADADGIPFGYAAAVDGQGVVWIGGAHYAVAAGTRRFFGARWDGAWTALDAADPAEGVRLYASAGAASGAWMGGYADTGAGSRATLWRLAGDSVTLVDHSGEDGRVEGLVVDGDQVLAAGWDGDGTDRTRGWLRSGGDRVGFVTTTSLPVTRFTGLAGPVDAPAVVAATDAEGHGWTAYGPDGATLDTVTGTATSAAGGAGYVWVAGTVEGEAGSDVRVRATDGAGFATSLDAVAAEGWIAEPRDLVVGPRGDVWLAIVESRIDGSAPVRGRLLHLDCR